MCLEGKYWLEIVLLDIYGEGKLDPVVDVVLQFVVQEDLVLVFAVVLEDADAESEDDGLNDVLVLVAAETDVDAERVRIGV